MPDLYDIKGGGRKLAARAEEVRQQFKERAILAKAKELDMPYVNLEAVPINPDIANLITKEEAEEAGVAIFTKSGKKLRVATPDINEKAQKLIGQLRNAGFWVEISLCSEESVKAAHKIYFAERYIKKEEAKNEIKEKDLGSSADEIAGLTELKNKIEESDFSAALNYIQVGAYKARASDIHFQPEKDSVSVRFRVDGMLHTIFAIAQKTYEGIIKEAKYLANLKLNIADMPQDGQYSFNINFKQINVRVSTLPTHYGESAVMRILDPEKAGISLENLGFGNDTLRLIKEGPALTHGMILVTGPTGSGKTTTLYALLKSIDAEAKKIITLENPIEYNLPGISQSQIKDRGDFDFAAGLKALLRQDPDVIMVGEIRDRETAETAVQASLTGHLVFSTLHTNSAVESIPRLLNMGIKSFTLAPGIDLIIAQRLVRRLCPACAMPESITESRKKRVTEALLSAKNKGINVPELPAELLAPHGCAGCGNSGFLGQIAIAEALRFDHGLRNIILEERGMTEIYEYIEKTSKMLTLYEDGILKAVKGITTVEEVERVSK